MKNFNHGESEPVLSFWAGKAAMKGPTHTTVKGSLNVGGSGRGSDLRGWRRERTRVQRSRKDFFWGKGCELGSPRVGQLRGEWVRHEVKKVGMKTRGDKQNQNTLCGRMGWDMPGKPTKKS